MFGLYGHFSQAELKHDHEWYPPREALLTHTHSVQHILLNNAQVHALSGHSTAQQSHQKCRLPSGVFKEPV